MYQESGLCGPCGPFGKDATMSRSRLCLLGLALLAVAGVGIVSWAGSADGQTPPADCADPLAPLRGPVLTEGRAGAPAPAPPEDADRPLPINLATALRLAGARPLLIAAAEARLRTAVAEYDLARLQWLPNVYVGGSYYRHDGAAQGNSGTEFINGRTQFLGGGGVTAVVSGADAIF